MDRDTGFDLGVSYPPSKEHTLAPQGAGTADALTVTWEVSGGCEKLARIPAALVLHDCHRWHYFRGRVCRRLGHGGFKRENSSEQHIPAGFHPGSRDQHRRVLCSLDHG